MGRLHRGSFNALLGGYLCYVSGSQSTNLGGFGLREVLPGIDFRVETFGMPSLFTYSLFVPGSGYVPQPFTVNSLPTPASVNQ